MSSRNDYFFKNTHTWKIKQAPYLQYKTTEKITASMKSEMGEGLL